MAICPVMKMRTRAIVSQEMAAEVRALALIVRVEWAAAVSETHVAERAREIMGHPAMTIMRRSRHVTVKIAFRKGVSSPRIPAERKVMAVMAMPNAVRATTDGANSAVSIVAREMRGLEAMKTERNAGPIRLVPEVAIPHTMQGGISTITMHRVHRVLIPHVLVLVKIPTVVRVLPDVVRPLIVVQGNRWERNVWNTKKRTSILRIQCV